jgi:transposase-like protein
VSQAEQIPMESVLEGAELVQIDRVLAVGGGAHDGSRIERDRERLDAIRQALHEGMPLRAICRAYRVSANTLAVIRERWPEPADAEKKRLVAVYSTFSRASVERALDELDKIPPGLLVLNSCQATDKMLLLMGEATSRVEHKREVRREDVEAWIARLPSAGAGELGASADSESVVNGVISEENKAVTVTWAGVGSGSAAGRGGELGGGPVAAGAGLGASEASAGGGAEGRGGGAAAAAAEVF